MERALTITAGDVHVPLHQLGHAQEIQKAEESNGITSRGICGVCTAMEK